MKILAIVLLTVVYVAAGIILEGKGALLLSLHGGHSMGPYSGKSKAH